MRHVSFYSPETETLTGSSAPFRAVTAMPAVLLALACIFIGCASDDDGDANNNAAGNGGETAGAGATDGDDGTGGADGNSGTSGAGPTTNDAGAPGGDAISISWMVREIREGDTASAWFIAPGLEGVEVCLIESVDIPCVQTDSEGVFVLQGVPTDSELLLTFTKKDYIPMLVPIRTGKNDIPGPATQPYTMTKAYFEEIRKAAVEKGIVDAGFDMDDSKGGILFSNFKGDIFYRLSGVSVSIDPAGGDGPFYLNDNFEIVPDATSASEGIAAAFFNLEEGEYALSWELEEPELYDCVIFGLDIDLPIFGLPAAELDTIRVPVRAGFITGTMIINCRPTTEPGADAGT